MHVCKHTHTHTHTRTHLLTPRFPQHSHGNGMRPLCMFKTCPHALPHRYTSSFGYKDDEGKTISKEDHFVGVLSLWLCLVLSVVSLLFHCLLRLFVGIFLCCGQGRSQAPCVLVTPESFSGLTAPQLTAEDYQRIMDRNWRRWCLHYLPVAFHLVVCSSVCDDSLSTVWGYIIW